MTFPVLSQSVVTPTLSGQGLPKWLRQLRNLGCNNRPSSQWPRVGRSRTGWEGDSPGVRCRLSTTKDTTQYTTRVLHYFYTNVSRKHCLSKISSCLFVCHFIKMNYFRLSKVTWTRSFKEIGAWDIALSIFGKDRAIFCTSECSQENSKKNKKQKTNETKQNKTTMWFSLEGSYS